MSNKKVTIEVNADGRISVCPHPLYAESGDDIKFKCKSKDWEVEMKGNKSPFTDGRRKIGAGKDVEDGGDAIVVTSEETFSYTVTVTGGAGPLDPDIIIEPKGPGLQTP